MNYHAFNQDLMEKERERKESPAPRPEKSPAPDLSPKRRTIGTNAVLTRMIRVTDVTVGTSIVYSVKVKRGRKMETVYRRTKVRAVIDTLGPEKVGVADFHNKHFRDNGDGVNSSCGNVHIRTTDHGVNCYDRAAFVEVVA